MSFFAALGFLTIIPVGKRALDSRWLGKASVFFSVVGLMVGLALAGADYALRLVFPDLLASALVLVLLVVLTGAIHFEGFVDACDGLFGGRNRESRLQIMRDKRAGAYAVAGGVLLLLVKVAAMAALVGTGRFWVLVLFPVLSRWGMALALGGFPYARQQGLGVVFRGAGPLGIGIAGAFALLIAVLFGSEGGLLLFGIATVLAWLLGFIISRMLGGLTGDTYGAINEVAEATLLVIAVAVLPVLSVLPIWQRFT